jgi:hypothetical protein
MIDILTKFVKWLKSVSMGRIAWQTSEPGHVEVDLVLPKLVG